MKAHAPDDATATSTSASGLEVSGIAACQTPRPTSSASRLARLRRHQAKIRQCAQELGVSLDQPTSNNAPRDSTKKATGAEGADGAMPPRHESAVPVAAPEIMSASTPPSAATRGAAGQERMQEQDSDAARSLSVLDRSEDLADVIGTLNYHRTTTNGNTIPAAAGGTTGTSETIVPVRGSDHTDPLEREFRARHEALARSRKSHASSREFELMRSSRDAEVDAIFSRWRRDVVVDSHSEHKNKQGPFFAPPAAPVPAASFTSSSRKDILEEDPDVVIDRIKSRLGIDAKDHRVGTLTAAGASTGTSSQLPPALQHLLDDRSSVFSSLSSSGNALVPPSSIIKPKPLLLEGGEKADAVVVQNVETKARPTAVEVEKDERKSEVEVVQKERAIPKFTAPPPASATAASGSGENSTAAGVQEVERTPSRPTATSVSPRKVILPRAQLQEIELAANDLLVRGQAEDGKAKAPPKTVFPEKSQLVDVVLEPSTITKSIICHGSSDDTMSMWTKMKLAGAPEEDVDDQLCASTAHPSASASEEEPMCNQENIRVDAQTERKQHDQVDNSHSFSPSAAANTSRAGPLALAQSAARGERLAVPLLHRVSVDDIQACLQSWSLQSEPVRIKGNPFVGADGVKLGRGLGLGGLGQPPLQQRPDRYAKIAQQPGAATTSYSLESLGTGASEAIQLCDHVKLDAEQQQAISFPAREKEMNVNAGRTSKLSESNLNLFDDENAKQWEQELTSTPGASPSMKMRPMSVRSPPDVAQMQESHSKGRFTSGAHRERDSILELSVDSWVMDDGECCERMRGEGEEVEPEEVDVSPPTKLEKMLVARPASSSLFSNPAPEQTALPMIEKDDLLGLPQRQNLLQHQREDQEPHPLQQKWAAVPPLSPSMSSVPDTFTCTAKHYSATLGDNVVQIVVEDGSSEHGSIGGGPTSSSAPAAGGPAPPTSSLSCAGAGGAAEEQEAVEAECGVAHDLEARHEVEERAATCKAAAIINTEDVEEITLQKSPCSTAGSGRGGGAPWPPIPPLSPWDHDAGAGAIPAAAEEPRGPRMALHETEEAFAVQSEPEDPTSARAADTREVAISANHAPAAAEEAVEKLKMEAGKRVFPLRADALMGTSSASSSWQADDTSSSRSRSGSAAVIDDLKSGVNSLLFPEQNYTRVETPIATSSPGLKMAGSSGKTKTAKTLSRCAADGALAIAPENKSGERTRIMVVANITEEDHCPTGAEAVGADNKARQAVEPVSSPSSSSSSSEQEEQPLRGRRPLLTAADIYYESQEVEQERVEEKKPARIISAPKEREDPFRLAETSSVYKTYLIYKQQLAQIRSQIRF